jgi:hypothetical protein
MTHVDQSITLSVEMHFHIPYVWHTIGSTSFLLQITREHQNIKEDRHPPLLFFLLRLRWLSTAKLVQQGGCGSYPPIKHQLKCTLKLLIPYLESRGGML